MVIGDKISNKMYHKVYQWEKYNCTLKNEYILTIYGVLKRSASSVC